jgi:hypothetical protein
MPLHPNIALPAIIIIGSPFLLGIILAMVLWAWESRPSNNRPPSTYGEEGEDEE